jgi:hypothetical protein
MRCIVIIERIHKRDASIKVLDRKYLNLSEDDPVGRGVLALLSALAEDERKRILKPRRAATGHDGAKIKAPGSYPGAAPLQERVATSSSSRPRADPGFYLAAIPRHPARAEPHPLGELPVLLEALDGVTAKGAADGDAMK